MKTYSPKSWLSYLVEQIIYSIVAAMWYCAHCGLKKVVSSLDKSFCYSWSCLWFLDSELALMWYMGCVFAGDQMWLNLELDACSSVWFFLHGLLPLLSVVSTFLDLTGNTLQSTILTTSMDQLRYPVACLTHFCECWLVLSSLSVCMEKVFLLGEKQEHIMLFLWRMIAQEVQCGTYDWLAASGWIKLKQTCIQCEECR